MKHVSNERGALPVLAVVLVALLVVVVGLAVYNGSRARNNDAQSVNTSPSPGGSPASTTSPAATPTPTPANVFIVKELGIQFTVSDDIKDLVYVARTNNGVTTASFSTASLVAADKAAGGKYCTAEGDAPLGAIHLASAARGDAVKTIGNQYLNYAHSTSACSQNSSVMNLAEKQTQAFREALKTTQAIQ